MESAKETHKGAPNVMFIARFKVKRGGEQVWEHIINNYKDWKSADIVPLYVTKRLSKGQTSFIVEARDSSTFADFLLERFSHLEAIEDYYVVNLMRPIFFPLPHEVAGLKRFTVELSCEKPTCKSVYECLSKIKPTEEGIITYMAFTFLERGHDLILSVLSKDMETLETFLHQNVTSIEGVKNISVNEITKTLKLATMFEWKKTVHPLTVWENLTSRDYEEKVYRDVIAGC